MLSRHTLLRRQRGDYVRYARIEVTQDKTSGSPEPLLGAAIDKANSVPDVHVHLIPSFVEGDLTRLRDHLLTTAEDIDEGRMEHVVPQVIRIWAKEIDRFLAENGDSGGQGDGKQPKKTAREVTDWLRSNAPVLAGVLIHYCNQHGIEVYLEPTNPNGLWLRLIDGLFVARRTGHERADGGRIMVPAEREVLGRLSASSLVTRADQEGEKGDMLRRWVKEVSDCDC